jgi:hypothetical protein
VSESLFRLAALSFVQHRYAWFPSYYFCAGFMLLGQFHRHYLAINYGRSAFCLHQTRVPFSDQKVYQGLQSIKDFQHNMRKVSCCNNMSTNGLTNSKLVAQSVVHKEGAGCLSWPQMNTASSVHMTWFCYVMKWQIICKLVTVLSMKLSTTDFGLIKSVQDGPQNSSQCCIYKHPCTSFNNIWIAMVTNVTPS